MPLLMVTKAQQKGRMCRDEKTYAAWRQTDMSAVLRHAACASGECIESVRTHCHDKVQIEKGQLPLSTTRRSLALRRRLDGHATAACHAVRI
jgi:hypothetical protein